MFEQEGRTKKSKTALVINLGLLDFTDNLVSRKKVLGKKIYTVVLSRPSFVALTGYSKCCSMPWNLFLLSSLVALAISCWMPATWLHLPLLITCHLVIIHTCTGCCCNVISTEYNVWMKNEIKNTILLFLFYWKWPCLEKTAAAGDRMGKKEELKHFG